MTTNGSVERFSTTISNVESPLIAGNLSLEITERFGLREEAPLSIVLSETAATTRSTTNDGNDEPTIIGGLNGVENWKWLYIRHLWVKEEYRGKGLGVQLMQMAETEAIKRKCQGMYIDTFDGKTADFYEQRCGFIRCGEILNFPPGNGARIYLKKELSLTSS